MTAHAPMTSADAGQRDLHLRIMATTDLHACLLPHDYCTETPLRGQGLSQTALLIAQARAEACNSLLFDNGDFLQGNPLADYLAQRRLPRRPHPVVAAFNALGYDAGTLGNHEFDFGLPFLQKALEDAKYPVVSANLVQGLGPEPGSDIPFLPPFALLDRAFTDASGTVQQLKIGVIGFAPPQTMIWNRQVLEGRFAARDIVEAAEHWVPILRAKGAEIVIALSHSGIGAADHKVGMENASTALARLPGIDAIVAGHSHLTFPSILHPHGPEIDPILGQLAGKPAVMPGHSGAHLGVIDLVLRRGSEGWSCVAHSVELRQTADQPTLPRATAARISAPVRQATAPAHRATRRWARRPIGASVVPLSTYFALVTQSPALRLIAMAQRDFVARAVQDTADAGVPVLSAVAPFKAGGRSGPRNYTHVPAGPLALRDIVNLYAFPNDITALRLTGAEIALWLERSASQYHHIPKGSMDLPLINPAVPSFNCDQIDGISYRIDLSVPARFNADGQIVSDSRRIMNLSWQGAPVRDDEVFLLATNNYRTNSVGAFPGVCPEKMLALPNVRTRDVLAQFIARHPRLDPDAPPAWAFAASPGTTVVFDSHPEAVNHTDLARPLALTPLGMTEQGFHRFRLHL